MAVRSKFRLDLNDIVFDTLVEEFITFLATAEDLLTGSRHPARKYYEARKNGRGIQTSHVYKNSTNPERATKITRGKRKQKYLYQLTQYQYYNKRRKAIQTVL